jgi:putative transposase
LRERLRVRVGRDRQPSAGVVDSQSLKSTGVGGEERGYELGGKKVKGRKRYLLVDTQGLVLKVKVHAASVMDWDGIRMLLRRADVEFTRLKHLWLDSAYRGDDKGKDWVVWALGWSVELVELLSIDLHLQRGGEGRLREALAAARLPGVTEAVGGGADIFWIEQNRRMSKDYERLPETSEAFVYVAMSRLMARRLARS